jgi:hypothetical protein
MEERKDQKRPESERPKLKRNSERLEVLEALSTIASMNFYGYKDTWGNNIDRGLRSDKGDLPKGYNGKQQIDGSNFQIISDVMILKYHSDATTNEVHSAGKGKYEEKIKDTMNANADFIKEQFRQITGKTLKLEQLGEPHIEFVYMNRRRSWVEANMRFRIGNLAIDKDNEMTGEVEDSPSKLNESFDLGNWLRAHKEDGYRRIMED